MRDRVECLPVEVAWRWLRVHGLAGGTRHDGPMLRDALRSRRETRFDLDARLHFSASHGRRSSRFWLWLGLWGTQAHPERLYDRARRACQLIRARVKLDLVHHRRTTTARSRRSAWPRQGQGSCSACSRPSEWWAGRRTRGGSSGGNGCWARRGRATADVELDPGQPVSGALLIVL